MAACSSLLFPLLLVLLTFSDSSVEVHGLGVGINYGQIANNLPSPTRVSHLLRSLNISRVKLYDADPNVLVAFSNTNVDFIIGLGNEYLQNMTDPIKAQTWVQQRVQPYLTRTRITCITVGNEVSVTTAHSLDILSVSFPPSAGAFRQDIGEYLHGILNFHAQVKSPFLINAYPYFAYKDSPNEVPLDYVLFQPNQGTMDPFTNLKYDNMLYAQVDAVYSAIKAIGHTDIEVRVSETGWPSKGDENEVGATPENAGLYNGNLFKRVEQRQGTPAKPNVPIDIYVFALFNENLKTGPASERNYGLFYPDGTLVYNIGVQGYLPELIYSSATKNNGFLVCSLLILAMTYLIFS
ncbi:glucan endo-1,3-beta-glucosidase 14-like isoform X2 [Hibiscus syriacus]|uniref:glucan endo-1,3-beta-glucosidase 14-like isoform X2 n=1 Tax=Hibiscus syriacus TaxID=106335 RepID=UPI001920EE39|nr:glucan endo-1,3-beta-glucosidase 14-like isoform X2 [Hibiscus syriacus]